jgi:hypothetical protein
MNVGFFEEDNTLDYKIEERNKIVFKKVDEVESDKFNAQLFVFPIKTLV